MTDDAAPAGDGVRRIAEKEIERMISFSRALEAVSLPDSDDPEALEAAQAKNLEALERMTEDVGLAAFASAKRLLDGLAAQLEESDIGASDSVTHIQDALDHLSTLQDAAAKALLRELKGGRAKRGDDSDEAAA